MEKDITYFYKKYNLRQNDLNEDDNITITSILDICQDAAGKHATFLNLGFDDLNKKAYFWVLTKSRVKIVNDIYGAIDLTLKTYQSEVGLASFNRDYYLYDENNKLCVVADSKWCVLDRETGKIVPSKLVDTKHITGFPKGFTCKNMRIDKLDNWDNEFEVVVKYIDIDYNHHMNNTKYTIPLINYFKNKRLDYFEIDYVSQSYLGDKLKYVIKGVSEREFIINVINETKDYIAVKCFMRFK